MNTVKEIQDFIFEQSGLKTGARKGTGSMKGYIKIWAIFQNDCYPPIPREIVLILKEKLSHFNNDIKPLFCTSESIDVYGLQGEAIKYKRESKPKETESRQWGSKNSQMRLDKAAARYAKKLKKGGCSRYY